MMLINDDDDDSEIIVIILSRLSGADVRPTFLQSQLPNTELGAIW